MNMIDRYALVRMRVKCAWQERVLFSYIIQLSLLAVGIGAFYAYIRFFTYRVIAEMSYEITSDSYFDGGWTLGGELMPWLAGFSAGLVVAIVMAIVSLLVWTIIASTFRRRKNRKRLLMADIGIFSEDSPRR